MIETAPVARGTLGGEKKHLRVTNDQGLDAEESSSNRKLEQVSRVKKRVKPKVAATHPPPMQLKPMNTMASPTPDQGGTTALDEFLAGDTLTPERLKEAMGQAEKISDSEVAKDFARMAGIYAVKKRPKVFVEAGGHETTIDLVRKFDTNPEVVHACLEALSELHDRNREAELYIAEYLPPAVRLKPLGEDPGAVEVYLNLVQDLVDDQDPAVMGRLAKTKVLKDCDFVEANFAGNLVETAQDIRLTLRKEKGELTLKDVYGFLTQRLSADEILDIKAERPIRRLWRFINRKTTEYGRDTDITDGVGGLLGSEFMYGCMCLQLLAAVGPDNRQILKDSGIIQALVESMVRQTDEQVAQHAVLTCLDFSQYEELVPPLIDAEDNRRQFVDMIQRSRTATENALYPDVEDLVGPRVRLVEATATNREVYLHTRVVESLIDVWDDYDFYFYGNIRVKNTGDLKRIQKADKKADHLGRRQTIRRRATQFFTGGKREFQSNSESDLQSYAGRPMSPAAAASPLARRKSMLETHKDPNEPMSPKAGSASPLERRKSVLQVGGFENGKTSGGGNGGGGGLMRRASQIFKRDEVPVISASPAPAAGSIAIARRASMAGNSPEKPSRRASFFGKAAAKPPCIPAPNLQTQDPKTKASVLQRRASMTPAQGAGAGQIARMISLGSTFEDPLGTVGSKITSDKMQSDYADLDDPSPADGGFIPKMLEYLFKALRRTVHPDHYPELYVGNVPMRFVGVIADPDTPPGCFADVLFLIGSLASFKDLRDLFGEYKAIECIVALLKRGYTQTGNHVSETVTNACLALAALVVVHVPNTKRFEKKHGCELAVDILLVRGRFNDSKAVNAASALCCNLCYKNSDMKKALGEAGACAALTDATAAYESIVVSSPRPEAVGLRSLASLFRAIGNMALNQENMGRFLESRIEHAFSSFLSQVNSAELDNDSIESCLRTLSNLVIEKDHMEVFGIVILPFLAMLRKERHCSAEVHRWAFLTLANLCRLPENAQAFVKNSGIETVLTLMPYLEQSTPLLASVIQVLGIQTTDPNNVPALLDVADIFKIIADTLRQFLFNARARQEELEAIVGTGEIETKQTFESHNALILQLSQLPISSLRCAHRVLVLEGSEQQAAEDCVKHKVFDLAIKVLQLPHQQPMLAYESLRVIFAVISIFRGREDQPHVEDLPILTTTSLLGDGKKAPSASSTQQIDPFLQDGWSSEELRMLQQGVSPVIQQYGPYTDPTEPEWEISPPPLHWFRENTRRVWNDLDMIPNISSLIDSVRRTLGDPRAQRNLRLQRLGLAFLGFIACEKIGITAMMRPTNSVIDEATGQPVISDDDTDIEPSPDGPPSTPPPMLQKKKSIWNGFQKKKDKERINAPSEKTGFGRDRRPDSCSSIEIVGRTLTYLWHDTACVDEAFILLDALVYHCFGTPELARYLADVDTYKTIKEFIDTQQPETLKPFWLMSFRNYKRFLQTRASWNPVMESVVDSDKRDSERDAEKREKKIFTEGDLRLMKNLVLDEFPYELSQWHIDPYPDGLMSLPIEARATLRAGGRCECFNSVGEKELVLWQASHDLILFEWKTVSLENKHEVDLDPTFPHNIAASRFTQIAPGTAHPYFTTASVRGKTIPEGKCCVLRGPATPSSPNGVNLCLKFKDSSSNREFVTLLQNWREACAFGFL